MIVASFVFVISLSQCCASSDVGSQVKILEDGSVSPSDAPIQRVEDTYEFTGDLNAELVVERSGIVIDGKGYTVMGTDRNEGRGVFLRGLTNVEVKINTSTSST